MKQNYFFFILFFSIFLLFIPKNGQSQQAINDPLYPFHPPYSFSFTSSNLPIVIINLDQRMADKSEDRRVTADMVIVYRTDGARNSMADTIAGNLSNSDIVNYAGKIGIKYRGNSSYSASDKKPFGLKTQDENGSKVDADILGMGADSDWALLAPFNDRSMIRDVLTFDLCRGFLDYVPTGKYCELVLNGVYQGVYIMAARVRRGPHRIDIPKPRTSGDELTGGYIVQIDRNDEPTFQSNHNYLDVYGNPISGKNYFQYTYPDNDDYMDGMETQRNYIINRVRAFESVMASDDFSDPVNGYRSQVDVLSAIDYILAQEIAHNVDGYRLSTYLYKYRDSQDTRFKLSIWDFNIAMGNADYCDGWSPEGWSWDLNKFNEPEKVPFWFDKLLNDETFLMELRERWHYCRTGNFGNANVTEKIDSLVQLLTEAESRNSQIWNRWNHTLWPNYYISHSWADEILFLRDWLNKRLRWMDSQLTAYSENLVANASFDSDRTRGVLDPSIYLSNWKTNGDIGLSSSVKLNGNYSLSFRYNGEAWQPITKLANGKYTFKVWVRTVNDPQGSIIIRRYNSNGDSIVRPIHPSNTFYEIQIDDIEIDTKLCEIAFRADSVADWNTRLYVDSVTLYRNRDEHYACHPQNDVDLPESELPIMVIDIPEEMTGQHADAYLTIISRSDSVPNRLSDLKKIENLENPNVVPFKGNIDFSVISDNGRASELTFFTKTENGNLMDTNLLLLNSSNEWMLWSLYDDPSLIRSATADMVEMNFAIYRQNSSYCNLVINGIYQGIYRFAIPPMKRIALTPPTISGDSCAASYAFDIGDETGSGFTSRWKNRDLFYQIVNDYSYYTLIYPENIVQVQWDYIENRIHQFENQIMNQDVAAYSSYLDPYSLYKFIFMQELFRNPEAYNSNITIYNVPENQLFQFTNRHPNHAAGNRRLFESRSPEGWAWNSNRFSTTQTVPFWIKKLLADDDFFNEMKGAWTAFRVSGHLAEDRILAAIDSLSSILAADQGRHFRIDYGGHGGDFYWQGDRWEEEIVYFKEFVTKRLAWMESQLSVEIPDNTIANHSFEIDDHPKLTGEMELSSWMLNGTGAFTEDSFDGDYAFELQSEASIRQTVTELVPGAYTLQCHTKGGAGEIVVTIYHPDSNIVLHCPIESSSNYQEIRLENIRIHHKICKIEIKSSSDNQPLLVDQLRLHCTSPMGIYGQSFFQSQVKVYPNPFSDRLVFEYLPQANRQTITIYSIMGVCVDRFEASGLPGVPTAVSRRIGNALPAGIYLYRIEDGAAVHSGKMVKN